MIEITTPFNTTWPETLHLEGEDEFHPKTPYIQKTIFFVEDCGNRAAVYRDGDLFVRVETDEDEYLLGGWFKKIETARLTDEEFYGGA